jgi:hypothetical protein
VHEVTRLLIRHSPQREFAMVRMQLSGRVPPLVFYPFVRNGLLRLTSSEVELVRQGQGALTISLGLQLGLSEALGMSESTPTTLILQRRTGE